MALGGGSPCCRSLMACRSWPNRTRTAGYRQAVSARRARSEGQRSLARPSPCQRPLQLLLGQLWGGVRLINRDGGVMRNGEGKARNLRSQLWFDDPHDPGMTALYLERYLNYG